MHEWISKEDDFVLKQSKKKAHIRVREGRAKPIDWLVVTLNVADSAWNLLEEDRTDFEVDVVDPTGIFEGLSLPRLQELGKEIQSYLTLEASPSNRKYWNALNIICQDFQSKIAPIGPQRRTDSSVSADVDRLLVAKSSADLVSLEAQVNEKLQSNEPIDVEYWEQLLRSITVHKAKADLNAVYKSVIESRLEEYRKDQISEAETSKNKLALLLKNRKLPHGSPNSIPYSPQSDPEPLLKLRPEDKGFHVVDEGKFMDDLVADRHRVKKLGYVPPRQLHSNKVENPSVAKPVLAEAASASRFAPVANDDFSQATTALYEREVARGVQENEEIFAGEEEVSTVSRPQWAGKYRPRKPRYFNRVQMGYEWNKYNQTHYDHDNPPPKVVQGYKFNIFYPDLIDRVKAPTYRIERENGRKRGQSFAPAGEEDTCLIRFISGPPYEDLAFRIVDKEWDYSAKRERGFRSSFDKGILQLHFQFKKVYYRK